MFKKWTPVFSPSISCSSNGLTTSPKRDYGVYSVWPGSCDLLHLSMDDGNQITASDAGLLFDHKLSVTEHVKNVIKKSHRLKGIRKF